MQFAQGADLVWYRTQHQGRHADIDRVVLDREGVGNTINDADRDRRGRRSSLGTAAQDRLWFDSNDLGDAGRVEGEVETVTRPDLDDSSGNAFEHLSTELGLAFRHGLCGEPLVEASEDRMMYLGDHWVRRPLAPRGDGAACHRVVRAIGGQVFIPAMTLRHRPRHPDARHGTEKAHDGTSPVVSTVVSATTTML